MLAILGFISAFVISSDIVFVASRKFLGDDSAVGDELLFWLTRGAGASLLSWSLYHLFLVAPGRSGWLYLLAVATLLAGMGWYGWGERARLAAVYRNLWRSLRSGFGGGGEAIAMRIASVLVLLTFLFGLAYPTVEHDSLGAVIETRIMLRDLDLSNYLQVKVPDPETGYYSENFRAPFLHMIYVWFSLVGGEANMERLARTVSPMFGLFCLGLLYQAARDRWSRKAAAWSVLLLAATPLFFYTSYNNGIDTVRLYLCFASLLWLAKMVERPGHYRIAVMAAAYVGFALYAHLIALPMILGGALVVLFSFRWSLRQKLVALALSAAVAFVAGANLHYVAQPQIRAMLERSIDRQALSDAVTELRASLEQRAQARAEARAERAARAEAERRAAEQRAAEQRAAEQLAAARTSDASNTGEGEAAGERPSTPQPVPDPSARNQSASRTPPVEPAAAVAGAAPVTPPPASQQDPQGTETADRVELAAEASADPLAPSPASSAEPAVPSPVEEAQGGEAVAALAPAANDPATASEPSQESAPRSKPSGAATSTTTRQFQSVLDLRGQGQSFWSQLIFGRLQMFTGFEYFGVLFYLLWAGVLLWALRQQPKLALDFVLLAAALVMTVVVLGGLRKLSWSNPRYIGSAMLIAAYFGAPLVARMAEAVSRKKILVKRTLALTGIVVLVFPVMLVTTIRGAKVEITNPGTFYQDFRSLRWVGKTLEDPTGSLSVFLNDYFGIGRTFRHLFSDEATKLRHSHDYFAAVQFINEQLPDDARIFLFRDTRFFFRGERYGVVWYSPENEVNTYYREKDPHEMALHLQRMGYTHVLVDDYSQRSRGYADTVVGAVVGNPSYTRLVFEYGIARVYELKVDSSVESSVESSEQVPQGL